ncbi:MAG: TRAP transporter large permease subunit, partial [Alphaproteobacteria bacterium]|nr:TRAP transporter large permease subunit [Alphaproteobacteria bacterium]
MIAVALAVLIVLLALSIPVAAALGMLGLALDALYSRMPLTMIMGELSWGVSNNFILVSVPFFILLGEILLRSGMAERMYHAMVQWVSWLPGGLMHSNVAACTLFAAT